MRASGHPLSLPVYGRLEAVVKSGVNPFFVLDQISQLLFLSFQISVKGWNEDGVFIGVDSLIGKTERVAFRLLFRDVVEFESMPELSDGDIANKVASFSRKNSEIELSSQGEKEAIRKLETIDWMRGFLKELSDYCLALSSVKEFENDLLVRWYFGLKTTQDEIVGDLVKAFNILEGDVAVAHIQSLHEEVVTIVNKEEVSGLISSKDAEREGMCVFYQFKNRSYEIWMEFFAACSCALALLGRSHHDGWARVLELSANRTQGLPGGVCSYKATGDQYRTLSRMVREKDSRLNEENKPYIVQVLRESIFFQFDMDTKDLTSGWLRKLGSAYCYFHYILCLELLKKSSHEGAVLYLLNDTEPQTSDTFVQWVMIKERYETVIQVVASCQALPIAGGVLGIGQGVYSIFSSNEDIPYTMRQVSDDFHGSMRTALLRFRKEE